METNLFNKNYYPTPDALIERLLKLYKNNHPNISYRDDKYKLGDKILEPSAGKGNILDFVAQSMHIRSEREKYYCIELVPELQSILKEKGYALIDDDFLQFSEEIYFDNIIMNPPFDQGAKHLLKAIEIGDSTEIACILNAQTIRNPHTKERKLLLQKLNELNYKHEFVQDAFQNAERKTKVEVVLIWLSVPAKSNKFDFEFEYERQKELNFDFDIKNDAPAVHDLVGNMQLHYNNILDQYISSLKAKSIFHTSYTAFNSTSYWKPKEDDFKRPKASYAELQKNLKRYMWKTVIAKLDIEKYVTTNVRKNLNQFIDQQCAMAFSKKNVLNFIEFILLNKHNILEQTIVEVFDKLTSHGYTSNRLHIETWKTNDAYKVKQKVIAPEHIRYGEYTNAYDLKHRGSLFSMSYTGTTLDDLDKVLCYIDNYDYRLIQTVRNALKTKFTKLGRVVTGQKFDNTCSSTFFDIKFYKKGTIHLSFKDKALYQEFNYRACHAKNWLPNDEYRNWKSKTANGDDNKVKDTFNPDEPELNPTGNLLGNVNTEGGVWGIHRQFYTPLLTTNVLYSHYDQQEIETPTNIANQRFFNNPSCINQGSSNCALNNGFWQETDDNWSVSDVLTDAYQLESLILQQGLILTEYGRDDESLLIAAANSLIELQSQIGEYELYLSDQELIAVAEKFGQFNTADIIDILLQNAPLKYEVLFEIADNIQNLPQAVIEELIQYQQDFYGLEGNSDQLSLRKEEEILAAKYAREQLRIVDRALSKGWDLGYYTEVLNVLANLEANTSLNSENFMKRLVTYHIKASDLGLADGKAEELESYNNLELQKFGELKQLQISLKAEGREISELNSSEKSDLEILSESSTAAGLKAKNMLLAYHAETYFPPLPEIPFIENQRRKNLFKNLFTNNVYMASYISPNPASDIIYFNFNAAIKKYGEIEISFYNTLGKIIKEIKGNPSELYYYDVSSFKTGKYLVEFRVLNSEEKILSEKLIITQ